MGRGVGGAGRRLRGVVADALGEGAAAGAAAARPRALRDRPDRRQSVPGAFHRGGPGRRRQPRASLHVLSLSTSVLTSVLYDDDGRFVAVNRSTR